MNEPEPATVDPVGILCTPATHRKGVTMAVVKTRIHTVLQQTWNCRFPMIKCIEYIKPWIINTNESFFYWTCWATQIHNQMHPTRYPFRPSFSGRQTINIMNLFHFTTTLARCDATDSICCRSMAWIRIWMPTDQTSHRQLLHQFRHGLRLYVVWKPA
jgi:hypothetical protein